MTTEFILQVIVLLIIIIAGIWVSPYDVNFDEEEY